MRNYRNYIKIIDNLVDLIHNLDMSKTTTAEKFRPLLRTAGLKATPERLAVLAVLHTAKKPLSVKDIKDTLQPHAADQATIYRTIQSLLKSNIVRPVNFEHDHNHYELVSDTHHHHLICERCGKAVDVSQCDTSALEKQVQAISGFATINHHALEFFGVCKSCAKHK